MRTTRAVALALVAALHATPAGAADETPVKGKIVAVDLFKNGLAVVKCEVTLGKPGSYVLENVPSPVHGTYWVEGSAAVETVMKVRDVEVPVAETTPGNLQDDFAGKKVTIHFRGANRPPVVGTMLKLKPAKDEPLPAVRGYAALETTAASRFLVVQTAKGRAYIEASDISSVEAEDAGDKVVRRRPQLVLTLGASDKAETKVALRYLTHGLAWAPSYRIDITDPKTLALEQNAVIRNELADLTDAEVRLISGFPSVQYAHVRSLLAARTNWATFFSELSNREWQYADATSNSVATQQSIGNFRHHNPGLGAIPTGEGVDLHYQPIGKRTLAEGDTLALSVAKGKAEYERIVEWLIQDTRDEYGRHTGRERGDDDSPWDALKFKNPLTFPMTTGPATVTANGSFNGQRTSYWVNAGEETVLRVEKALSVRTRAIETEQQKADGSGRDFIWIGGRQYRRTTVEGELAVSNHRKESVSMVIRRRFSGELVAAEGNPTTSLREEGVFSINKRNEMVWTMALKGGEEKKLKYSYTVLVPH
jgi:hypothetical protein